MAKRLVLNWNPPPEFLDNPENRDWLSDVLAWCNDKFLGSNRPKPIHSTEIRNVFGNKDRPGPSQWLFTKLVQLECPSYEPEKKNKTYSLKRAGYEEVHELIGVMAPDEIAFLRGKFASVLRGDPLEYKGTGQRRFHEIQNVRRETRRELLADWWDYDIEACAPTLVYQSALREQRRLFGDGPEPFPALARLVSKKVEVRQQVAELTGFDPDKTKQLLARLFFRASAAPHPAAGLFSMFGGDRLRFEAFLADPFIDEFRTNVKSMWRYALMRDNNERSEVMEAGGKPSWPPRKASKRRMHIYLSLERRVMNAMEDVLAVDGVVPILMHDGFMSRTKVDADALVRAVKDKTGFDVRLQQKQLGETAEVDVEPDVDEVMEEVEAEELDEVA